MHGTASLGGYQPPETSSTKAADRRAALACRVDQDAGFAEFRRASMTKPGDDGRPVVRDGRVVKSARFLPDGAAVHDAWG